ncbi:MAG: ABC transporter ATP-binding protein [Tissierellia bacterium]|nr:ABC transporter ATP-binding protein [Tissierellia bacterium]
MYRFLENKFVLSPEGARNMGKSIIYSALMNLSNILPMVIIFNFLTDVSNKYLLHNIENISVKKYFIMVPVVFILIYLANNKQYDSVYTTTYTEAAKNRIDISRQIGKLPLSFFAHRDLSDLTRTIMTDVEKMEHAYSHAVPQFYGTILSTIVIVLLVSFNNVKMALAMFWPFPIALLLIFLLKDKKYKVEKIHANQMLVVSDKIQEILDNILPIRAYGRTEKTLREFDRILQEEEEKKLVSEKMNPLLLAPISSLFRLGIFSILIVGFGEYLKGGVNLPMLLNVIIVTTILYTPMEGAMTFLMEFLYVTIPAERMREMLDYQTMTGEKISVDHYDIEVKDVYFSYGDEPVINGVSFTAKQGEVTALVGHSGCGKTTLVNLMLRFYDVEKGRITLGGKDIQDFDPDYLLTNYSMVFQDVLLFNNTIMENIRIGKKDATDAEVLKAAKIAQVDDFVSKLPDGYKTMVGERGALLSGGERQRISIARAILKDAPIIFLDESTASVDADSETRIQNALSHLIKEKTVVVIAHRLRTIMNADKILVFEEGKIMEEGNSEELIQKKGIFYRMLEHQKS